MLALLTSLIVQDPAVARAESLLAAGRAYEASQVAATLVARRPRDPRAHVLLGRAHYARPVIGRYHALAAFRRAAELAPHDPEPLWWQTEVGYYLGSDEGEVIVREAALRILALQPAYRDTWERFQEVYHDAGIWARADSALARHGDDPTALERRAELAIALEQPARADSLLARLLQRQRPHVAAFLRRAEAAFLSGRLAAGQAWFDSALTYADLDSNEVLWDSFSLTASPEEAARHDATPLAERGRFYAAFWGRRDPDLLTPENERLAEHFERLAYARRFFRLLHPFNQYHRSTTARARAGMSLRDEVARLPRATPELFTGRSGDSVAAGARGRAGLDAVTAALGDSGRARSAYAIAGLDARGLLWVRHGRPDVRVRQSPDAFSTAILHHISPLDAESWGYYTADGPMSVAFLRATGGGMGAGGSSRDPNMPLGGDFVFRPVVRRQVAATTTLLRSDRTTVPAPVTSEGWRAFFRSTTLGLTDVYYRLTADTAALVLWDAAGEEVARTSGTGPLAIAVAAGDYTVGLDARAGGQLARLRAGVAVPRFGSRDLSLSSLVIAAADTLGDREGSLAGMPGDLVYAAGASLAAYAEVYGLTPDTAGRARYRVRYAFAPARGFLDRVLRGVSATVFEFDRDVAARATVIERLVLASGRVPPGRYRVSLAVTDLVTDVKSETATLELTVR